MIYNKYHQMKSSVKSEDFISDAILGKIKIFNIYIGSIK